MMEDVKSGKDDGRIRPARFRFVFLRLSVPLCLHILCLDMVEDGCAST